MTDSVLSSAPSELAIQVVYALPDEQFICDLRVQAGTTVEQAVERSGLRQRFSALADGVLDYAVFGVLATPGQLLHDGDRVEILRPLLADPKVSRRQSVAQARKSAGQRR